MKSKTLWTHVEYTQQCIDNKSVETAADQSIEKIPSFNVDFKGLLSLILNDTKFHFVEVK